MRKFKVLRSDMRTPFQNYQMELDKKYVCEDFDADPSKECSCGFYATDLEGLTYSINSNKGNQVFECEVGGKSVINSQFKQRFETIELIRKVPMLELKRKLKLESKKLGYNLLKACYPKNSLLGNPKKVTQKEIELLKQWVSVWASVKDSVMDSVMDSVRDSVIDSVRDSVMNSVWDSVWDSVWASVRASVRASVWDSVWASVGASVWAYISSFFPNIAKWQHIDHAESANPFQSCIDLWHNGFVPSFDGTTWRLHSGRNAKIVFETKFESE